MAGWNLIIDDNFNRANVTAGGAGSTVMGSPAIFNSPSTGGAWTDVQGGVWGITSNQAISTSDSVDFSSWKRDYLARPSSENVRDVRVVLTTGTGPTSNSIWWVALRCTGSAPTETNYLIDFEAGTSKVNIYAQVNGSVTQLGASLTISPAFNTAHQYALDVSAVGNGTTVISIIVTDTTTSSVVGSTTRTDTTSALQVSGGIALDANNGSLKGAVTPWARVQTYYLQTTVFANDPNLFLSPYNWYVNGTQYTLTNTPGAYFKVGFGGTSVAVGLDCSPLFNAGFAASTYPYVRYSIDNGPVTVVQLTSGTNQIVMASGLTAGSHTAACWFVGTQYSNDRRGTPANIIKLTYIALDSGDTPTLPATLPHNALFFGDSLTEGHDIYGSPSSAANDDAQRVWAYYLALALNAEYGQIGFGSQGWTVAGGGNVPPVFTPGDSVNTAWNQYYSGQSRLMGGRLSPAPDYVIICHGRNDGGASSSTLTSAIQGWLTAVRAAASLTKIIVIIPFTGTQRSVITAAVQGQGDSLVFLIDLGPSATTGLTGSASLNSYDGTHPNIPFHAQLGAMLSQAIESALFPYRPNSGMVNTQMPQG